MKKIRKVITVTLILMVCMSSYSFAANMTLC